ncbi:hypothetical protein [Thermoleptolyngbya sp. M55_K2018_002]|uniref:hypothetical protein n=1 Tax=Thermoleptolyngbya sp. M55_K2018_002 TaxID=2747808 RepID=UPI0019F9ED80|nr:hypothetical protein [Thermoleptolyngbya sp. M55_K2018_002]HIK39782.1 hypothetical protein [Thermoleptolyngbya sp. M55_K2018_002]
MTLLDSRLVAQTLLDGDFSRIPEGDRPQVEEMQRDFERIMDAVLSGNIGAVMEAGDTAGERLRQFGACGLRLRNSGSAVIQPRNLASEATILQQLNEFLSTTQDDQALKLIFGDLSDEAIAALRNGSPYQSKSEFVEHNSTDSSGTVTGLALWARFETGRTSENQTGGSESGAAESPDAAPS